MARSLNQTEAPEQTTRRMSDYERGGDGEWTKYEDWFTRPDTAEFSEEFAIHDVFEYLDADKRPKYGFQVRTEATGDTNYCFALPKMDSKGAVNKDREKLFKLFEDDKTAMTGCILQRIDMGKDKTFVKIISVEKMESLQGEVGNEEELPF